MISSVVTQWAHVADSPILLRFFQTLVQLETCPLNGGIQRSQWELPIQPK